MLSTTLSSTWVKNVYRLCVEGVVNSVLLSPTTDNHLLPTNLTRVKPSLFTHILSSFTPLFYTPKNVRLSDTYCHLSPLSTAPTINKTKENMKGNS
jgi:hypothetical protein